MENPYFSFAERMLVKIDEFFKNDLYKTKKNVSIIIAFVLFLSYFFLASAPSHYPIRTIVNVKEGSGLYTLSIQLENQGIIRSAITFRSFAILLGGENSMKAGDYFLSKPENAFIMARRIIHGDRGIQSVKITIPEGFTKQEIVGLFDSRFLGFDRNAFMMNAREGYLFPDTYFIEINATATSTINLMKNNFDRKILPFVGDISKSKHTLNEIIIMASILEAEAKTPDEMLVASGILWKRLKISMPLQVDSDLSTYNIVGLPKYPINNPGLNSIRAAIYPTNSSYLYFLTDKTGVMHYAKTFDEHKINKIKYLK